MKKISTRASLITFIIISVFSFNIFANATPAQAQTTALCQAVEALISAGAISADRAAAARAAAGCQITTPSICSLIDMLISAGIISPDKAAAARAAAGCVIVTPVISPLNVELISQDIIQQSGDIDTRYAVGNFKFKATAVNSDVYVENNIERNAINVIKNGQIVGKVDTISLSSTADELGKGYLVKEGDTETFTMSYVMKPLAGSGFYQAKAILLPLDEGSINLDGPDNKFISNQIYLQVSGTATSTVQTVPTANILGQKDLALQYNPAGKESQLVTSYSVSIAATGTDAYIPLNPFTVGLINTNGSNNSVRSAKTVTTLESNFPLAVVTVDGMQYQIVPAGKVANFGVMFTVNTSELFAGSYYARLYGTWMPYYTKSLEIYPLNNTSNKVTIIGETSPYITFVSFVSKIAPGFDGVKVTGVRLSSSQLASIKCDNVGAITNKPSYSRPFSNGTVASFVAIDNLPSGTNCSIQLTDPKTGASNIAGFQVTGGDVFVPGCPLVLTRDLTTGSTGADVTALQNFLGVAPATGYFGPILKTAVISYQKAHGISPADGRVGAMTRAFITKVDICAPPVATSTLLFVSEMNIVGAQSTYTPGQTIRYSVKTLTTDDRIGMPAQGFNVQARIETSDAYGREPVIVDGVSQSVNATYNSNTYLWDVVMKAPSDTSKNYTVDTGFYCSRFNQGLCGERQINKQFNFTLLLDPTPVPPTPVCPTGCTCDGQTTSCPVTPDPVTEPLTASCSANPSSALKDQEVVWTAKVAGGTGTYSYKWSGDGSISGNGSVVNIKYGTTGTKATKVEVKTSSGEKVDSRCSVIINKTTTSAADEGSNYATASINFESFLKLLQALR